MCDQRYNETNKQEPGYYGGSSSAQDSEERPVSVSDKVERDIKKTQARLTELYKLLNLLNTPAGGSTIGTVLEAATLAQSLGYGGY